MIDLLVSNIKMKKRKATEQNLDESKNLKCSMFVILRGFPGMGEKIQEIWDGVHLLKNDYGFTFVGASNMYLGRECQFEGLTSNLNGCVEKLHEFLKEKYDDR